MIEIKMSESDKLIRELMDDNEKLKNQLSKCNPFSEYRERIAKKIDNNDEKILILRTEKSISLDKWLPSNAIDYLDFKIWDIVIIPWICITIGNYAISDYTTYDNMRNLFEKGIELYAIKETIKPKPKLTILGKWQFSSWLKFLYATVKYLSSKKLKKEGNVYKLNFDDDFASFFKESGEMFAFINKENTDPKGRDLSYWKGPRNYCNKILWRCSKIISIDLKERGKKEMGFYVREQEK